MRYSFTVIIALLVTLSGLIGVVIWLDSAPRNSTGLDDRLQIVTTVYPLADFIAEIGGEFVNVTNIIPPGAEPHDYEPSAKDIAKVLEADVLIYLGGGFDAWAEALSNEVLQASGFTLSVADSVGLEVANSSHDHAHTDQLDPHIWLDPVKAQEIVLAIRDVLLTADQAHEQNFMANAEAYTYSLKDLHESYTVGLNTCQFNDIIVSHDAFGYLARRYNFNIHPINGVSPEAEPSIRDLASLSEEVTSLGVNTIFFETLVSPQLAETLAAEVNATTAVLDPLEGLSAEALAQGQNYLSVMQTNLQALRAAMICQ